MRYVALYRRSESITESITMIENARIRQIATAKELGIGNSNMIFIQIERIDYGYEYYNASSYRVLEAEKI